MEGRREQVAECKSAEVVFKRGREQFGISKLEKGASRFWEVLYLRCYFPFKSFQ